MHNINRHKKSKLFKILKKIKKIGVLKFMKCNVFKKYFSEKFSKAKNIFHNVCSKKKRLVKICKINHTKTF